MSRLDLVIFGATGFTGKKTVEEAVRLCQKYPFTWAVAGRSESKLNALLKDVELRTGQNLSNIEKIIADVSDYESLKKMCKKAKVVVNCCGPYRLYGEPVVKACLETKTHQVDVSGEPQFIEGMQLKYDQQAREAGVYIISACGFDSVPNDLGVMYLKQNFNGILNSVESYLSVDGSSTNMSTVHYGTWQSLVYSLAHWSELPELRKKLYPNSLPRFQPKLATRSIVHRHCNTWCVPFPGSDTSIVYRTQRYLYDNEHLRPTQFRPYVQIGNLMAALTTMFAATMVFVMTKTSITRSLLLKYPRLFSFGVVSHEGPSEEAMNSTLFTFTLHGEGWDGAVTDTDAVPPNKTMMVKVRGINPGYGATVTSLLLCGLTILSQKDKMPSTGGVLTTGAAFHKTDLIDKLNDNSLRFEVVKKE